MKRVRVAFVGVGSIAQVHLERLRKNEKVELVAVCDINEEQSARVGKQYGAVSYTDSEKMMDQEKPDAIFVCVPPFAHGNIEENAAKRGIHLFVEKPLGLDMDQVRSKAEAIRQSGIITSTGYCMRYLQTAQKAKAYLQGKEIAHVDAFYLGGFVEVPWWRDMAKSGGQLVEQATHIMDLAMYLAGDVRQVYSRAKLLYSGHIPGMNIPDVHTVSLEFASGAVGHMDTTCVLRNIPGRLGIEMLGPEFRLSFQFMKLVIFDKDGTHEFDNGNDMYEDQDNAFIEAILRQDRSLVHAPYETAARTLEVTLAANRSAETGEPVNV